MPYLTNDQKADLLAALDDAGLSEVEPFAAANAMNAPRFAAPSASKRRVPMKDLQLLAFNRGVIGKLIAGAKGQDAEVAILASEALSLFSSPHATDVDTEADAFADTIAALKTATIMTTDDETAVMALADVEVPGGPIPTLFEDAMGGPVSFVIDGVPYDRCHAALIEEARA